VRSVETEVEESVVEFVGEGDMDGVLDFEEAAVIKEHLEGVLGVGTWFVGFVHEELDDVVAGGFVGVEDVRADLLEEFLCPRGKAVTWIRAHGSECI
jgi:hypothetical protein